MVRDDHQTILVRLLGRLEIVLVLVASSKRHQRLSHVLPSICMGRVQIQGRLKVLHGLLEAATVGVQRTTGNKAFYVPRIDAERLVEALEGLRVSTFFKVLDSLGNRSGGW